MTKITSYMLADMRSRRENGDTVADIAARHNVKTMTVYQRLRREYGTPLPGPANDNNPSRVTRMTARNGGCSTTSGKMPVTLVRIPSVDGLATTTEQVAA
jgi:transposase-like protein